MMAAQKFEVPHPPPRGTPNVDPDEAIAIALMGFIPRSVNPQGRMVQAVLKALDLAGWQIVPKVK